MQMNWVNIRYTINTKVGFCVIIYLSEYGGAS
ncbi:hypothetical protein [Enterococcus phage vB_Efm8_KEN21]